MNNNEISHFYDTETINTENNLQNGGNNKIARGGFPPIIKVNCNDKKNNISINRPVVAFEPVNKSNIININDIIKHRIKRS